MAAHAQSDDRILTFDELHERIPYTRQHIGRLERDGQFPKRIQLGPARVGWSLREVLSWIEDKKAQRQAA